MPKKLAAAAIRTTGALALALLATGASASFHTFVIEELYSDASGNVQFIELHEASGLNGQDLLAGHTLTSTSGATTRLYTFATNLPNSLTANKRVLIATQGFANLGIVTPDYIVPAPFLFPGGGTLNYAGVDVFAYPALPGGVNALYRTGGVAPNLATNYAGQSGAILPPPPPSATPAAGIPTLAPPLLALLATLLVLGALVVRRFR
jgi:hypothetical protein